MVDLSKQITFGSLFKKSQGTQWPTKTTMNLAQRETTELSPSQWLIPALIILLLLALFLKFGIYDQFAKVSKEEAKLSQVNSQLAAVNSKLTDYDAIEEEYGKYSSGYLTPEEAELVDPVEALGVIEQTIMAVANVESVQYSSNVMTVNFSGLTLARVGELMTQINALPSVSAANVYTAGSETDANVMASAVITLHKTTSKGA